MASTPPLRPSLLAALLAASGLLLALQGCAETPRPDPSSPSGSSSAGARPVAPPPTAPAEPPPPPPT